MISSFALIGSTKNIDSRSYKVDFSLYKSLAKEFYPTNTLDNSIEKLAKLINEIDLPIDGFRNSRYIRLNHIRNLIERNSINKDLRWRKKKI